MSGPAIVILLGIGLPLLAFAVWQLLQEALVQIEPLVATFPRLRPLVEFLRAPSLHGVVR